MTSALITSTNVTEWLAILFYSISSCSTIFNCSCTSANFFLLIRQLSLVLPLAEIGWYTFFLHWFIFMKCFRSFGFQADFFLVSCELFQHLLYSLLADHWPMKFGINSNCRTRVSQQFRNSCDIFFGHWTKWITNIDNMKILSQGKRIEWFQRFCVVLFTMPAFVTGKRERLITFNPYDGALFHSMKLGNFIPYTA